MPAVERELVTSRARQLPAVLLVVLGWVRAGLERTTVRVVASVRWTRSFVKAEVSPVIAGPVTHFVLGRHPGVSAGVVLLSAALAPAVAWVVVTTTGSFPLQVWAQQTVTGTDPHGVLFAVAAALVGLGVVSAALNAGLLPTTLLVVAPLFGLAATRYGTTSVHPVTGPQVVSLPAALEFAAAAGLLAGVPLALLGFSLGLLLRYGLRATTLPTVLGPG